jgi:hypothetical protein
VKKILKLNDVKKKTEMTDGVFEIIDLEEKLDFSYKENCLCPLTVCY